MMRRLSFMFLILVLAGIVYNYYQIVQVRKELRAIGQEVVVVESNQRVLVSGSELADILAEAKEHSERAGDLLSKGRTKQAKAELDKSLQLIEKALKLSEDGSVDLQHAVGQALSRIRAEAEKAWRDFSSEAKKESTD